MTADDPTDGSRDIDDDSPPDPVLEAIRKVTDTMRVPSPEVTPESRTPTTNEAHPEPKGGLPDKWPELGALVNAASGSMRDAERESLKQKITSFVALHPAHVEELDTRNWDRLDDDVKAAASAIWNEAAAIVGRAVSEQHLREYREDLLAWWRDPHRETASEEDVRKQHPFLARVWDAMKELARHLLKEAVQAAVIEMLFPGAHLIIPPTNLVAALFTAGGLGDIADGVA